VSFRVEYHPFAALEIAAAEDWYERERASLGDRFLTSVEAAVNRVRRWPNTGKPVVFADDGTVATRQLPIGGFPWAVGYEVTNGRGKVLAVFHQHRSPDYWTTRDRG
jgi:hypothetical protein